MHHQTAEALLAVLGAVSIATVLYAFFHLLRWRERRFWAQLDAEYRASAMLQEAKREVRRG